MNTLPTIFLDMDDVVANWMARATEILQTQNHHRVDGMYAPDAWAKLRDDKRFYRNLPLMPGATHLVDMCQRYLDAGVIGQLAFLTAIPSGNDMPWAIQDKVWWAHERFPNIPVFFGPYSQDKQHHVRSPGDILIDDRLANCKEWEEAGGIAHQFTTWEQCEVFLKELLGPI